MTKTIELKRYDDGPDGLLFIGEIQKENPISVRHCPKYNVYNQCMEGV